MPEARTLFLNGTIAEESWFDDDVTPQLFKDELMAGSGDITVWINSPGGDCVAAAQIYNMLIDYKGNVTVKIDGIAASAASVIAMAGTKVLMSPVSMMMIHNPMTVAFGDSGEMQKAIDILDRQMEIFNAVDKKDTEIREHEMEMARMADKKDTEKKEFNWKVLGAASFVVLTAVGIGTAALGGKFDFKLPKKN